MSKKKYQPREIIDGVPYAIRRVTIKIGFSIPEGLHETRLCTDNSDDELASYIESYINTNLQGIAEDYDEDYPNPLPPVSRQIN